MRLRIALLLLIALSPLVAGRASGTPATGHVPQPQMAETAVPLEPSLSSAASPVVDEPGSTVPTATMLDVPAAEGEKSPTGAAALEPDPGWQAIMTEDFEGVFPPPDGKWTVQGLDPRGNVYWDDDDYLAHSGNWSAYCARGGAFGVDPGYYLFSGYPQGMYTTMEYGPFDLRDATAARLTFYYWNQSELNHDLFWWIVSWNGMQTAAEGAVSGDSGGWVYRNLDLMTLPEVRDWPDGQGYIQFGFQSDFSNPYVSVGAFVDDIVLEKALPNLVPYKPDGWAYPIVPSSVPGTNSVGPLYVDQPTYIDSAVANTGRGPAGPSHTCLYLDGTQINCWDTSGLGPDMPTASQDWVMNAPTAGPHTLRVVADANNEVVETNESDNAWEMTFTWLPAMPGAFSKSSPGPGATGQPTNLGLIWRPSGGADSYEYCYDTTNDNNCDGSWKSSGGRAGASLSGLSPGTTYYWQVRAVNARGTTYADSGTWWSFTTRVDPPGAFAKTGPANGATGQPTGPNLSWGTSAGATSYQYCVNTAASCSGTWTGAGSNTSANLSGLLKGTTYYWQVRAQNTAGTTEADGGTWWSFTTAQVDLPSGFSKISPTNEATGQPTSLTLNWGSSNGATSYEYCYDTSGDNSCGGNWTSTGSSTSASLTDLSRGITYYWQVRALNGSGTTEANGGAWWSFTTSAEPSDEWLVYLPVTFRSYSGGGW